MQKKDSSGHISMDKAIARDIAKETGADAPLAADAGQDDPIEQGARTNARQHHQAEARHDLVEGGDEVPTMDAGSGKTGKSDKGGKDSGSGNVNSRRDANSG